MLKGRPATPPGKAPNRWHDRAKPGGITDHRMDIEVLLLYAAAGLEQISRRRPF
jgi:hypothetical protein